MPTALTDESSPAFIAGFFQFTFGVMRDADRVIEAARHGGGVGWHEHNADVFDWLRALLPAGLQRQPGERVAPRPPAWWSSSSRGSQIADIGCGHGLVHRAIGPGLPPRSTLRRLGLPPRVDRHCPPGARPRPGVSDRVSFEVALAQHFAGSGFDLVTTFDALHDMGDP